MDLLKKQQKHEKTTAFYVSKESVQDFSSNKLSKEEHQTLSHSLDYDIL